MVRVSGSRLPPPLPRAFVVFEKESHMFHEHLNQPPHTWKNRKKSRTQQAHTECRPHIGLCTRRGTIAPPGPARVLGAALEWRSLA